MINKDTLLIWDHENDPPSGDWYVALWRGYRDCKTPNEISIPELVEANALLLRSRYLTWIHDLGETSIDGNKIVDKLSIRKGFSYWWMTSIAQKANFYESKYIVDSVKCLAIENYFVQTKTPQKIIISTTNYDLLEVFEKFCNKKDVEFHKIIPSQFQKNKNKRFEFPNAIKAVHCLSKLSVVAIKNFVVSPRRKFNYIKSNVTLFDIFVHLDPVGLSNGIFKSLYWTRLVNLLELNVGPTTWYHTFFKQKGIQSLDKAESISSCFNDASNGNQLHIIISSQITLGVIKKALSNYIRLYKAFYKIRFDQYFAPRDSSFNFWTLFRHEWKSSLTGSTAIMNCVTLANFEFNLAQIPYQKLGIYIQENQPWELALLYAWKEAGHGKIIGVPHTTIRFWDLRYFYDPRTLRDKSRNCLPKPDLVALNGPPAVDSYYSMGYPTCDLVEVEALRYFHLNNDGFRFKHDVHTTKPLTILICGDNLPDSNNRLINLIISALDFLNFKPSLIFKPHNALQIDLSAYNHIESLASSTASLPFLLDESDVVIMGCTTSAAIDAYYMNKELLVMADGTKFNACPLREFDNVKYFFDPKSLSTELNLISRKSNSIHSPKEYFYLDESMPRWQALLNKYINPVINSNSSTF